MKWRTLTLIGALLLALLAGCGSDESGQVFQATLPAEQANAPVYSATPSAMPTNTPPPSLTPTPTITPTFTPSLTPTITPTVGLLTLTPVTAGGAPPALNFVPAGLTNPEGWSCGDFPCEDDIAGFMNRIRVPDGFALEHAGRLPGQPMQIAYGPDGRLYATVLEGGTRWGAIYALNPDGSSERYAPADGSQFASPVGLAFQPGTSVLYVTSRVTPEAGGALWRVMPDRSVEAVLDSLPCCFSIIDNQPNGIIFGPDGYLYMGVGALTDHLEAPDPRAQQYAELNPLEAAVLRIHPHTGEIEVYAQGLRNPYDLAFDSGGQFYATDSGLLEGPGDRLLRLTPGGHYGWPYWRSRGCADCPPTDFSRPIQEDWLSFPDYTLPRGLMVYTAAQFPVNFFDNLFVALWNAGPDGQRIVRIDPRAPANPEPFVTGLIRPVDVAAAPDGSLVVADFIYGHVWRVRYVGAPSGGQPALFITSTPAP